MAKLSEKRNVFISILETKYKEKSSVLCPKTREESLGIIENRRQPSQGIIIRQTLSITEKVTGQHGEAVT